MPVQYSVIIKMGCGKKIAAAVHIDIIVFYFSKQYNEDKKGVCFYEVSEICRENGLKAGCVACAVRIRSDLLIIPGISEPPARTLRATVPENERHIFR